MDEVTARATRHEGRPTLPWADAEVPETRERRCPACHGERIVSARSVTAAGGAIKVAYRCEGCGRAFYIARPSFT